MRQLEKKKNCHKQNKTRISILHLSRTYEKDTLSETEKNAREVTLENGRAEKKKGALLTRRSWNKKEENIVVLKTYELCPFFKIYSFVAMILVTLDVRAE